MIPADAIKEAQPLNKPISLCILGSTGSIGCSALDVVRKNRKWFQIHSLVGGKNIKKLVEQAIEFQPQVVICAENENEDLLRRELSGRGSFRIESGRDAIAAVAADPNSACVLAAIVGVAGLAPVMAAIGAGKKVALANKESLVVAGQMVREGLSRSGATLVPVDSEHSAIFQALMGRSWSELRSVILTASGGPFLNRALHELSAITPQEAINHPRWNMGAKISVDSATLMNKALELIEAHWLFAVDESRIEVVIHPESIVHSLIRLVDGSLIAQLSVPDMRGAIAFALMYPHGRLEHLMQDLDLAKTGSLNFMAVSRERFRALDLARQAIRSGGLAPAVLNVANEVAVDCFLKGELSFDRIVPYVEEELGRWSGRKAESIEELIDFIEEVKVSRASALFA